MTPPPRPPRPWWLRWYALGPSAALFTIALLIFLDRILGFWDVFTIPSESMAPTLRKGDLVMAWMRGPHDPRRGELVLVKAPNGVYLVRVAGLPGDRIALHAGIVILNGRRVEQRQIGEETVAGAFGPVPARRLSEQFPGEEGAHHIFDTAYTPVDDMAEQQVKPGHVFLLGDNRDSSADSRVPRSQAGLEQVPFTDVKGTVPFRDRAESAPP